MIVVRDEVWKSLQTRQKTTSGDNNKQQTTATAVLNIFVTHEDMVLYSKEIKNIASYGHAIELTLCEPSSTDVQQQFFVHPTVFRGKSACTEWDSDEETELVSVNVKSR